MENLESYLKYFDLQSFITNFVSGLLLLVIGSIFLPRYLRYLRRPKMVEFFFNETSCNKIKAKNCGNGKFEFDFEPILRHDSEEPIREGVFWSLHFPEFVEVTVISLGKTTMPGTEDNLNFYGKINHTIFKDGTFRLQYRFVCKFDISNIQEHFHRFAILSWFSTEFGDYPKNLKRKNKYGDLDIQTMTPLWVELK